MHLSTSVNIDEDIHLMCARTTISMYVSTERWGHHVLELCRTRRPQYADPMLVVRQSMEHHEAFHWGTGAPA